MDDVLPIEREMVLRGPGSQLNPRNGMSPAGRAKSSGALNQEEAPARAVGCAPAD